MKFHARKVGYNTTLLKVYESMKWKPVRRREK
jgi:hypothetical protein